jgi:hypothetical protein
VTLWSPPHLLGLVGGILNAFACWLIACEAYPARSRARLVALVMAGALVYGGISLGIQPAIRIVSGLLSQWGGDPAVRRDSATEGMTSECEGL